MTTNLERWRFYMKDITSPDIFIDMGFYYMISAALQRRVYLGSDERPLFPNLYIILVADPGIGKGLVIIPVAQFLKHHKMKRLKLPGVKMPTPDESLNEDMMNALMEEYAQVNNLTLPGIGMDGRSKDGQGSSAQDSITKKKLTDEPLVIPMSADAITYEGLVRNNARAIRSVVPPANGIASGLAKNGVYTHSSICFCLEEISSLFRQHTRDVVNYLIRTYDCGDYRYETKTQGIEQVKNTCVNLFGGTQPSFMKASFSDRLLNEGFASRTLFVYADSNRFERFDIATMSPEQLVAKEHLLTYIKSLTELFGRVSYTPEAREYMRHYVEQVLPGERKNAPPKLLHYFARKRVHTEKLCMAIHFADNLNFEISLDTCEKARAILLQLEEKMEHALDVGGRNPLGGLNTKVLNFIRRKGPVTFPVIWQEFVDAANEQEIGEVVSFLIQGQKIVSINGVYVAVPEDGNRKK